VEHPSPHLQTLPTCPICSSSNLQPFLTLQDHSISKEQFTIQRCTSCDFKFTNPRPDAKSIGRYYQSEDYISHTNSKKGVFNQLYQVVRNYTIHQKTKWMREIVGFRDKTLLDYGCGTGEFLNQLKKEGWRVNGIEADDAAKNLALKNYGLNVMFPVELKSIPDDMYSIVTLWHVLEHIHELNETIEQFKRILHSKGNLVIAVPNSQSKDAEIYKEHWAAYDVPRHLYHFTEKTIKMLFEKHGFQIKEVRPMKFDAFYVSMLSEKYKNGSFLKAILNGWKSNRAGSADLTKYSSLVYLLEKNN
jgi:2-polyprenyl-3-methyl-5-hydroxy-6-metoxy-1,4-benzoquinol methylase